MKVRQQQIKIKDKTTKDLKKNENYMYSPKIKIRQIYSDICQA